MTHKPSPDATLPPRIIHNSLPDTTLLLIGSSEVVIWHNGQWKTITKAIESINPVGG